MSCENASMHASIAPSALTGTYPPTTLSIRSSPFCSSRIFCGMPEVPPELATALSLSSLDSRSHSLLACFWKNLKSL